MVQHVLETTGSLVESFLSLGFKADNIFITGKLYSNCRDTEQKFRELGITYIEGETRFKPGTFSESFGNSIKDRLWGSVADKLKEKAGKQKIIILDDGGYGVKYAPKEILKNHCIVGVEQTTSGLSAPDQDHNIDLPVIQVAASACKKLLEPHLIAKSILTITQRKIPQLGLSRQQKIGIIGFGDLGVGLYKYLIDSNYDVCVFDIESRKLQGMVPASKQADAAISLVRESDVVFGCTGCDISSEEWTTDLAGTKILISCSSSDIEFRTLLKRCSKYLTRMPDSPLDNLMIRVSPRLNFRFMRGGFPINFDGSAYCSIPAHEIQLTRALLLIGVIQANFLLDKATSKKLGKATDEILSYKNYYTLNAEWQHMIAQEWLTIPSIAEYYDNATKSKFNSIDSVAYHSGSNPSDRTLFYDFTASNFKTNEAYS